MSLLAQSTRPQACHSTATAASSSQCPENRVTSTELTTGEKKGRPTTQKPVRSRASDEGGNAREKRGSHTRENRHFCGPVPFVELQACSVPLPASPAGAGEGSSSWKLASRRGFARQSVREVPSPSSSPASDAGEGSLPSTHLNLRKSTVSLAGFEPI